MDPPAAPKPACQLTAPETSSLGPSQTPGPSLNLEPHFNAWGGAHQVSMWAHQVSMGAHQESMGAHQVSMGAHQVNMGAHQVSMGARQVSMGEHVCVCHNLIRA